MFFLGSVILVPIGGARHAFPILWNTLQVQSESPVIPVTFASLLFHELAYTGQPLTIVVATAHSLLRLLTTSVIVS